MGNTVYHNLSSNAELKALLFSSSIFGIRNAIPLPRMRQVVFFQLRLSFQNTAAFPIPVLSLKLVQRLRGSHVPDILLIESIGSGTMRALLHALGQVRLAIWSGF